MSSPSILLDGTVGSQAYGLATKGSDVDTMSVHVQPTVVLTGLDKPPAETIETKAPDSVSHEIGKFLRLSLGGNPNILEFLWLPVHTVYYQAGNDLINIREDFLSQEIRHRYLGYADQQFKRLERDHRFPDVPIARKEKHARHLLRLLQQGMYIWRTGELKVEVDNPDELHDAAKRVIDPDVGNLLAGELCRQASDYFDSVATPLPLEPARTRARDLLADIRAGWIR